MRLKEEKNKTHEEIFICNNSNNAESKLISNIVIATIINYFGFFLSIFVVVWYAHNTHVHILGGNTTIFFVFFFRILYACNVHSKEYNTLVMR